MKGVICCTAEPTEIITNSEVITFFLRHDGWHFCIKMSKNNLYWHFPKCFQQRSNHRIHKDFKVTVRFILPACHHNFQERVTEWGTSSLAAAADSCFQLKELCQFINRTVSHNLAPGPFHPGFLTIAIHFTQYVVWGPDECDFKARWWTQSSNLIFDELVETKNRAERRMNVQINVNVAHRQLFANGFCLNKTSIKW